MQLFSPENLAVLKDIGTPTIVAALIASMVAVSGWFIGSRLVSRREDRTRRLALTIEHAEKQIGELYAPILGLIEQLDIVFRVQHQMFEQEPHNTDIIRKIAYREFFLPVHVQILEILKTKIHLLENFPIPESFIAYIHHFTSQNLYWRLTQEQNIQTAVTVSNFPNNFYLDVRNGLDSVYQRRESALRELRHR